MPCIKSKNRIVKDTIIDGLFDTCKTRGDINYCITKLVHLWVVKQMAKVKSLTKKYDILNDAYGIMCSAAAEFYSSVVVPYEKLKRKENGAVSQLDEYADGKIPDEWRCKMCMTVFDGNDMSNFVGCCLNKSNWEKINVE